MPRPLKCNFCGVSCTSSASLLSHIRGQNHERSMNRIPFTKERAEASICIEGVPDGIKFVSLWHYFLKYGEIIDVSSVKRKKSGQRDIILEFRKPNIIASILKQAHHLPDCKLTVKKHPSLYEVVNVEEDDDENDVFPSLEDFPGDSFEEQCHLFLSKLQLPQQEIEKRRNLANMIQDCFLGMFPSCSVHPFGSSVTGLGLRGCDLDLFIDLGLEDWRTRTPIGRRSAFGHLPQIPDQQRRVRMGARLLENVKGVRKIEAITRARVPIIKFEYVPSNLACDISFHSPMPLRNSLLIRDYTRMHPHVRSLMMLIRLWAKKHDVSGSGLIPKVNNYALTMLVIFSLQYINPPVLPTVRALQKMNDRMGGPIDVIDYWDTSFCRDIEVIMRDARNHSSLKDLVRFFFGLYSSMDFDSFVVSPFVGDKIHKGTMCRNIPMEFSFYLDNLDAGRCKALDVYPPACLQDPFNLSFNLMRNVDIEGVHLLQEQCAKALDIIESVDESELLSRLLGIKENKSKTSSDNYNNDHFEFSFENHQRIDENTVLKTIKRILEIGLRFSCQIKNSEKSSMPASSSSRAQNGDVSSNQCNLTLGCDARYPTWENRNKLEDNFDFPMDMKSLEKEGYMSDYLIDEFVRNRPQSSMLISFLCKVKRTPGKVNVIFVNSGQKRAMFSEAVVALRKFIIREFSASLVSCK